MTHFWNPRSLRWLRPITLTIGVAASFVIMSLANATTTTYNGAGSQTWKAPAGVTSITVEAWGAGGAGGGATANPAQGGGGAGGQYVRKTVTVVPGTNYTVVVGAGGTGGTGNGPAGGDSTFASTVVVAKGGAGGTNVANGVAGLGSTTGGVGDVVYAGGHGSNGDTTNLYGSGGGGAGSTGAGGAAVGRAGGIGTTSGGGDGGNGRNSRNDGRSGNSAGGGGGGGYTDSSSDKKGGGGGDGMVTISYANLPTATTNAATAIGPNDATLNGAVSSNDGATTVTFEYGLTTSYGTTITASQSPLAFDAVSAAVSAVISGLAQSTAYHFRVNATNSAGTVYGADRTFTTSGPPVVLSINRANFDPTAANMVVAWTVVFDRAMTGVDTTDFSMIQAGGATGASITSVTGSGTTWTVTANTGTGKQGTVRLDLIDDDTIVSVSGSVKLGGTGLGNGSFSGQTYTIVTVCTNAYPQIFCDDFERANPGAVGTAPNYGAWTVTPANTNSSCSGGAGNTGCAGIDSDIPPFNTYTNPRANSTRSMFTRWSTLTVDSPTINLSAAPAALLSFWMRRGSDGFSECPEAVGENYLVQFWDGAAWQILAQYPSSPSAALCGAGEVWTPVIQLPPAALHAGFKLRFAQPSGSGKSGSGGAPGVVGYDYWHLDNVIITEAPASSYTGPFCDNFEGGLGRWSITAEGAPAGSGVTAGLEIGDARLGTSNFNSAGNALDMRWGYVVASTLRTNMTGVTGNINYWLKSGTGTRDPASGQDLLVEYFNDGGTWTTLATYQGSAAAGTVYNGSHPIPANAKHAGFRLRFRLLAGSGYDLSYWHVDDVCVGTVVPTADLAITKTRAGAALVPGTNVPYTITVTNNGPGAVAGTLQVVDTLPAGLSFYSTGVYGTGWACSASGQVVTCNYEPGALASGASAPTLTITAVVSLSATGTIINTATVFGSVIDIVNTANNTATDTGTILGATLVAQYRMEDASWGVLTDSAGYVGGPFNGSSTGSPAASPAFASPALGTIPGSGTCGYASLPGPASGGGALTTATNLPLLTSAGVKTSVAFWMYWDGTTSVMPLGWNQYGLMLSTSGTGGAFGFTTTGSDIYGAASSTLANGWHHVAAVFTNGSVVDNLLYVDGVLQTLTQRIGTPTLANAVVSTTLTIGGWGSTTGFRFTGRLDEVKVYKDVLVQSDVTAIYAEKHTCVAAVDHYELTLPTTGISCLSSVATVTACANSSSPCSSASTLVGGKTALLGTSAGSLGATTLTFNASGVASTLLSYPTATDGMVATVTLSGEQVSAVNARKCCPDGVSCVVANSCSTTFNTVGFIFSSAANGASVPAIPTPQIAGTTSGTYYLRAIKSDNTAHTCGAAFAGPQSVNFAYECNNPASCYTSDMLSLNGGVATTIARNNDGSVSSYTAVGMTFDSNGNAPFTFAYSDVGQIKLYAKKTLTADSAATPPIAAATLTGTSNGFVVKPAGFKLTGIARTSDGFSNPAAADASGTKFVKAGEEFSVTVTALTSTGGIAHSYGKESPAETVKLTSTKASGLGLTNDPALSFTSPAFGAFTNDVASGTTFSWNEAGIITLVPSVGDGSYLGAGDTQCNPDPTIVPAYAGATACPLSGNVGRFYAAKFELTNGAIGNRADLGITGSMTAGSPVLTLASAAGVKVGDSLVVAGAGTAGAPLSSTVSGVSGAIVTLSASAVTAATAAPVYVGAFTYVGEPMRAMFTLTAKAVDGTTTLQNYAAANSFAKLDPMAAVASGSGGPLVVGAVNGAATRTPFLPCAATPAHPCLSPTQATAGTFALGVANVSIPFSLYRDTTTATGPYSLLDIAVAPQDSDGAILTAYNRDTVNVVAAASNHALVGQTTARYGRLAMQNMYGSDSLALAIPIRAQYWNGSSFVSNPDDSVTPLAVPPATTLATGATPAGAPGMYFYPVVTTTPKSKNQLRSGDTIISLTTATLIGGSDGLKFTKPTTSSSSVHPGWLDVILSVPSYLQYNWGNCSGQVGTVGLNDDFPCARATFGVYKSPLIYRRENY